MGYPAASIAVTDTRTSPPPAWPRGGMTAYVNQLAGPIPNPARIPDPVWAQLNRKGSPPEEMFAEAVKEIWPADMSNRLTSQRPVIVNGRLFRLDYAWEFEYGNRNTPRVGIEIDGFKTHSSPEAIANDRARQRLLDEQEDWVVARWGAREVFDNPRAVAQAALDRVRLEVRRYYTPRPWAAMA